MIRMSVCSPVLVKFDALDHFELERRRLRHWHLSVCDPGTPSLSPVPNAFSFKYWPGSS